MQGSKEPGSFLLSPEAAMLERPLFWRDLYCGEALRVYGERERCLFSPELFRHANHPSCGPRHTHKQTKHPPTEFHSSCRFMSNCNRLVFFLATEIWDGLLRSNEEPEQE